MSSAIKDWVQSSGDHEADKKTKGDCIQALWLAEEAHGLGEFEGKDWKITYKHSLRCYSP